MSEKDKIQEVDALEIEPLSDQDLETVGGGLSVAGEGCSVGCTESYTCQCGTGSCCTSCNE